VHGAGSVLVTVSGRDRPGLASWLLDALAELSLEVTDIEQVQVHGRLLLCCELAVPVPRDSAAHAGTGADTMTAARDRVRGALVAALAHCPGIDDAVGPDDGDGGNGDGDAVVDILVRTIASVDDAAPDPPAAPHLVTVLAPVLSAATLATVLGAVTAAQGNIDRIGRLSTYPVVSYELEVADADPDLLRRLLGAAAAACNVDVAVQRAGLHRRAKHLIVLDADSTLIRGEVIDLLAERVGRHDEVAAITAQAMAGGLDFSESLQRRLALLAGLPVTEVAALAGELVLSPGARTLIRTLRRLGYVTAVVTGGFTQIVGPVAHELGIDFVAANTLEVCDDRLTGGLVGPIVDRAGKAAALRRFAALAGVPMERTIAVGDGANDIDMLSAAGLGIAFNAKPAVRGAADAAINVPFLDAILFLLGMSRREIEAADAADAGVDADGNPTPDP
jgi:phosphoserine phosphatase